MVNWYLLCFFTFLGNGEYFYLCQSNDIQAIVLHSSLENVYQSPKKTRKPWVKKDSKVNAEAKVKATDLQDCSEKQRFKTIVL